MPNWPRLTMSTYGVKYKKIIFSRVEGQIHIISYFEVTYPRTNIPTMHGLEYFGKELARFYDDNWKFVVAYASQSNNKIKAKYNSYERECLTIVWAISLIWCYCYGSPFTLVTIQVLNGIRSIHRNWIFKLTRWAHNMILILFIRLHYNKMRHYKSNAFIRFWVNSLVPSNGT